MRLGPFKVKCSICGEEYVDTVTGRLEHFKYHCKCEHEWRTMSVSEISAEISSGKFVAYPTGSGKNWVKVICKKCGKKAWVDLNDRNIEVEIVDY